MKRYDLWICEATRLLSGANRIQGSIPQASHLEASTPALPVPLKRDPWCGHRSTGVVDLNKNHKQITTSHDSPSPTKNLRNKRIDHFQLSLNIDLTFQFCVL